MEATTITPIDGPSARDVPVRVVGISGSLRRESFNRKLLHAAAGLAPPAVEFVEWDGLRDIPPFSEDDEATPPAPVTGLRAALAGADALLLSTPEYNGSVPGQLQNVLDWASRPRATNVLRGKPVAVIGASPSPGGTVRAQADARRVLEEVGALLIDGGLALPHAHRQFDERGALVDPAVETQLAGVLGDLLAKAEVAREQRAA
jgi:chromate reductase